MALNDSEVDSILRTSRRQLIQHHLRGLHEQIIESLDDFPLNLERFAEYNAAERRLIAYVYSSYSVLQSIDSVTANGAMASLANYTGTNLSLENAVLHWGPAGENAITFRELLSDCSEALTGLRNLIEQLGLPPPDQDGDDGQPPSDDGGGGGDGPDIPPLKPSPGLMLFLERLAQPQQNRSAEPQRLTQETEEEYVETEEQEVVRITLG